MNKNKFLKNWIDMFILIFVLKLFQLISSDHTTISTFPPLFELFKTTVALIFQNGSGYPLHRWNRVLVVIFEWRMPRSLSLPVAKMARNRIEPQGVRRVHLRWFHPLFSVYVCNDAPVIVARYRVFPQRSLSVFLAKRTFSAYARHRQWALIVWLFDFWKNNCAYVDVQTDMIVGGKNPSSWTYLSIFSYMHLRLAMAVEENRCALPAVVPCSYRGLDTVSVQCAHFKQPASYWSLCLVV